MAWFKTECRGLDERDGKFRVRNGRTYIGIFEDKKDAKRALDENSGTKVAVDKKRRTSKEEYLELLKFYNTHFVDAGWIPGDAAAHLQFRRLHPEVVFTCPVAYALGLSGKDACFWQCIEVVYRIKPKLVIDMALTRSGVHEEKQKGFGSSYGFHKRVIVEYVARGFHKDHHAWVTKQTNHFVCHHMGWLMMAHQIGLVTQVEDGHYSFCCGSENQKWRFQAFSSCSCEKYEMFSTVISAVLAASPVKTLHDLTALAEAHNYHSLWLLRGAAYGERVAADLPPLVASPGFSCAQYDKVLPDGNNYLDWLGDFGKLDVKGVSKKYFSNGRDALLLSMDTCFAGWLRNLDRDAMKRLTKKALRDARAECMHPKLKLEGHPTLIVQTAINNLQKKTLGRTS